jgi:N-acetylglucosaminyldiphosphoundecaprenol N-acetyl-beta-D-mannosaminyltransferase
MNRGESGRGDYRTILGINFFSGSAKAAVDRMEHGGLLVVPAAPALKDLACNPAYREALEQADLCIADSSFMVLLWNLLERDSIHKLSGLAYLRELLSRPGLREHPEQVLWVMANPRSAQRNLKWLRRQGIFVPEENVCIAPVYGKVIEDSALLKKIGRLQPRHIFLTIGGGTQERVGLYIKKNLNYAPSIHCIGAAIAFLSGDQVQIPVWADHAGLGWLYRCVSAPQRYVPRYWEARKLIPLMLRYRSRMPLLEARG